MVLFTLLHICTIKMSFFLMLGSFMWITHVSTPHHHKNEKHDLYGSTLLISLKIIYSRNVFLGLHAFRCSCGHAFIGKGTLENLMHPSCCFYANYDLFSVRAGPWDGQQGAALGSIQSQRSSGVHAQVPISACDSVDLAPGMKKKCFSLTHFQGTSMPRTLLNV